MQEFTQGMPKEEVIRKLLIAVEQISKIPDHLVINFNLTLAVMDPTAVNLCQEMMSRWNSQYQPSVKLVPLDDKRSIDQLMDDLEKQPPGPIPPSTLS